MAKRIATGLLALGLLLILGGCWLSVGPSARAKSREVASRNNLKALTAACLEYADALGDRLPSLVSEDSARNVLAPYLKSERPDVWRSPGADRSYVCVPTHSGKLLKSVEFPADLPILYDPKPRSGNYLIAFADGGVRKRASEKWRAELAKQKLPLITVDNELHFDEKPLAAQLGMLGWLIVIVGIVWKGSIK